MASAAEASQAFIAEPRPKNEEKEVLPATENDEDKTTVNAWTTDHYSPVIPSIAATTQSSTADVVMNSLAICGADCSCRIFGPATEHMFSMQMMSVDGKAVRAFYAKYNAIAVIVTVVILRAYIFQRVLIQCCCGNIHGKLV